MIWDILPHQAIGAYNHAMRFGPTDYRIYYACIEYDNHTVPGFGSMVPRLCLARSSDGISWYKPSLGVTPFPSNIMAFCYEVSVFEDLNPEVSPAGRYKMLCNKNIYEGSVARETNNPP